MKNQSNQPGTDARELLSFIEACPTVFQTVGKIRAVLSEHGYTELQEQDAWELQPGGKYFVERNGSSILSFRLPESFGEGSSFRVVAAHGDSPTFKIKPNGEEVVQGAYARLNVEKYGGMICNSWMDRPLSVAGRVVVETENGIETRLVDFGRDIALIPNVAIHMNRSVNEGAAINAQVDMLPLVGIEKEKGKFAELLEAEIGGAAILGSDLYLYNRTPGSVWGMNGEFVSAPRLDDMMCVYAGLRAFLDAGDRENTVPVLAVFDNEEVGSSTRQGAASSLLEDVLRRVSYTAADAKDEELVLARQLASSFMISADNAHAVHPNHPEYADADNRPILNGGVVVKYHAGQQYTTDALSEAVFKKICAAANARVQTFANRSDMRGGSTLGNIAATRLPLLTVDIGIAQLAMHSSYETAGTRDLSDMIRIFDVFFNTGIMKTGAVEYEVKPGK